MQTLFSLQDKKYLSPAANKSEDDLEKFLCDNWKELFPQYVFIAQQFPLKGEVDGSAISYRIDILAFNPITKRFVVFELKRDDGKHALGQASTYRFYITQQFFMKVYVEASKKQQELPNITEVDLNDVELILIAKSFLPHQVKQENYTTLIKYNWFENDLLLLDYVTNASKPIVEPPSPPLNWDDAVNNVKPSVRKRLQAIPFIKENIPKLKEVVEQAPIYAYKRDALLKLLEKLEKGDTM